ncbi:MAG TPA: DUF805 domain-containing protein [Xanthobacteraceae bacterium]|jgi:uncharacterized membrane protein YhaH (DUF805 family)
MSLSQLLFSFQGRLNRKPYWMTAIAVTVLVVVLILLVLAMVGERKFGGAIAVVALLIILYIPLIWVGLAVGAKRLHDRDKSAWWLLLFYAAPSVLSGAANEMDTMGIVPHLASFAITVWAIVELGFLRGTAGPNRYGPDPLALPASPVPPASTGT